MLLYLMDSHCNPLNFCNFIKAFSLKHSICMSEKDMLGWQRYLACFVCGPYLLGKSICNSECDLKRNQDFAKK